MSFEGKALILALYVDKETKMPERLKQDEHQTPPRREEEVEREERERQMREPSRQAPKPGEGRGGEAASAPSRSDDSGTGPRARHPDEERNRPYFPEGKPLDEKDALAEQHRIQDAKQSRRDAQAKQAERDEERNRQTQKENREFGEEQVKAKQEREDRERRQNAPGGRVLNQPTLYKEEEGHTRGERRMGFSKGERGQKEREAARVNDSPWDRLKLGWANMPEGVTPEELMICVVEELRASSYGFNKRLEKLSDVKHVESMRSEVRERASTKREGTLVERARARREEKAKAGSSSR